MTEEVNGKGIDYTEALEAIYKNIEETKKQGNHSLMFKLQLPSLIVQELEGKNYKVEEKEVRLPSDKEEELESVWFTTISWEN